MGLNLVVDSTTAPNIQGYPNRTRTAQVRTRQYPLVFHLLVYMYMGGCQNYGPFLGTLNIGCRIKIGIPKKDHNFDNHPYILLLETLNPKVFTYLACTYILGNSAPAVLRMFLQFRV